MWYSKLRIDDMLRFIFALDTVGRLYARGTRLDFPTFNIILLIDFNFFCLVSRLQYLNHCLINEAVPTCNVDQMSCCPLNCWMNKLYI